MNDKLCTLDVSRWEAGVDASIAARATHELETGKLLFMPGLRFALESGEERFLSPQWLAPGAKNVSYDPRSGVLGHAAAADADRAALTAMTARFARFARALVLGLCPHYARELQYGLTSFRVIEAHGRATSPKKDDMRLHVDAFASRPTQGLRILRVFCNVNPHGEPRVWEIGEPFDTVAERFHRGVPRQLPGSAWLLEKLHVTKGRRSEYDHIMLNLHDRPKLDDDYQRTAPKTRVELPAQSTWMVFTDRVMHAALAGQFMLEQTFYLPVAAMQDERYAPLRILERLYQRKLA